MLSKKWSQNIYIACNKKAAKLDTPTQFINLLLNDILLKNNNKLF